MSKARTLANLISDNAELADGQISVAEVVGAAPTASPTFTGTASGTFSGPLTGNVTGNLTGNLTGNVNTTLIASPTLNATVNIKTTDANGEGIGLGIDADKKVRFYDDQGVNTKMYWNASTVTQKFEDNSKLAFGSSEDLKLYHDGINKLVGDLTQTGKLTTDATDLSALVATISDTAVDVFVYDTSKDSDGGAWRKRTQNTSWYNEALNTATRGSRKEFPAVAVIVAESNQVTIYDGDDPDMPMWMVFNGFYGATAYHLGGFSNVGAFTGVTARNGTVLTSSNGGAFEYRTGLGEANLIKDSLFQRRGSAVAYTFVNSIIDRNLTTSPTIVIDTTSLVSGFANDVAMTVLPNAPIDAATGLPVPTIAVATNGGVSVIKDDGTVVDITTTSGASAWSKSNFVAFRSDNKIVSTVGYSSNDYSDRYVHINTIPSADFSVGNGLDNATSEGYHGATGGNPAIVSVFGEGNGRDITSMTAEHFGQASGLSQVAYAPSDTAPDLTSMVAYTTSTYNTGWMNGDIKLATLSDTDDTDANPSELVTNGDFSNGTSGWTAQLNAVLSVSNGQLSVQSTGSNSLAYRYFTADLNESYILTVTVISGVGVLQTEGYSTGTLSAGTHTLVMPAGRSNNKLDITPSVNTTFVVDNVSIKRAEQDRSFNGKGLQVVGTVTKTAVATGADLMAYSGFSSSNYLQQPYNADLNFGTGEYAFIIWFNKPSDGNYTTIATRGTSDSAESMRVAVSNSGVYFDYGDGSAYAQTNIAVPLAVWNCLVCTAKAGQLGHVYLNGVEQTYSTQSGVPATFLTATDYTLIIGKSYNNAQPWGGSLALARISATIPSPEQIDKIYNDEKVLFQDGAQATLYGTSDAVTALAHDDTTDLLHVGTSAGRSVFQGLRRVDNTTTAVGAAISASNGLVAED
jgi:hypothetical protein